MTAVSLFDVGVRFGDIRALDAFSCEAPSGRLTALLGPSGCGKTTALRAVAGFAPIADGIVRFDAEDVTRLPPERRESAMVFQSYALWPHMTVADNIAFGLRLKRLPSAARRDRVARALAMVGLTGLDARLPDALSGGQRQRVALARALALQPRVLLLDEPMSNLDANLRAQTQTEIRQVQTALGLTAILVTHDQDEAMAMADRIVLMRDGRVEQIGSPEDLYERPISRFAAGFIGRMNFLPVRIVARHGPDVEADLFGTRVRGVAALDLAPDAADGIAAVRPDALQLSNAPDRGVPIRIEQVYYRGSHRSLHARLGDVPVEIDLPAHIDIPPDPRLVVSGNGKLRVFSK